MPSGMVAGKSTPCGGRIFWTGWLARMWREPWARGYVSLARVGLREPCSRVRRASAGLGNWSTTFAQTERCCEFESRTRHFCPSTCFRVGGLFLHPQGRRTNGYRSSEEADP